MLYISERERAYWHALRRAGFAKRHGETAHYAVLEDRSVIYRAKVDPVAGAVKLTSTLGGRSPAHCTAVGKLLRAG